MTARGVAAAWLLVLLAFASIAMANKSKAGPDFHGAQVAVIGSSPMRYAIPEKAGGSELSLLGDGRSHWRRAVSRIDQDQMLALFGHAIDEGVQVVLIEANPLLFDFKDKTGRCDPFASPLRRQLKSWQMGLVDSVRRMGRAPPSDEPLNPDLPFNIGSGALQRMYPLRFSNVCREADLAALARKAKARGVDLVLVLPPRAATAGRYIGRAQLDELDRRAQALASEMGAELFAPAGDWPDAEFVDQGHLNRQGRAHFLAALRLWWSERR